MASPGDDGGRSPTIIRRLAQRPYARALRPAGSARNSAVGCCAWDRRFFAAFEQ